MPRLTIAPRESKICVGRLDPAGSPGNHSAFERQASVRRSDSDVICIGVEGSIRSGKALDVKQDVHWVLQPTSGGFQLSPVSGWYQFGTPALSTKPTKAAVRPAAAAAAAAAASAAAPIAAGSSQSLELAAAEAELRRDAGLRMQHADRWETMLEKRSGGIASVKMVRGQIPVEAAKAETKKAAYPVEERLNDDSGIKRHKQKMQKALKRKADAMADNNEVPETANSLHNLKSENAEVMWDFEDGEKFSDDEQELVDFDEDLQNEDAKEEAAPAPEAGDEASEAEDNEDGDPLSTHGKELEVLLERHTGVADAAEAGDVAENCAASSDSEASTDEDANAAKPRSKPGDRDHLNGRVLVATPRSVQAEADDSELTDVELRRRTIACLRSRGGGCQLSEWVVAMGLRKPGSTLYKRAVAALKEVADFVHGDLRLKREHQHS